MCIITYRVRQHVSIVLLPCSSLKQLTTTVSIVLSVQPTARIVSSKHHHETSHTRNQNDDTHQTIPFERHHSLCLPLLSPQKLFMLATYLIQTLRKSPHRGMQGDTSDATPPSIFTNYSAVFRFYHCQHSHCAYLNSELAGYSGRRSAACYHVCLILTQRVE